MIVRMLLSDNTHNVDKETCWLRDGAALALAGLLGAVACFIQIGSEIAIANMSMDEENAIVMVSRVLTSFVKSQQGLPKSWDSFVQYVPNEENWRNGKWPIDARQVQFLLKIDYQFDCCYAEGTIAEKVRMLVRVADQGGWMEPGRRQSVIDAYFREVVEELTKSCGSQKRG